MTNQPRTARWVARTALGGAFALSVLSVLPILANSWGQPPPRAPAAKSATQSPGSVSEDLDSVQDRDGVEVLEAQLEAKRTQLRIDESRAELAKRWKAYYEKLFRDGKVVEDRMLAAGDDVLMMDAHIAAERAELKVAELRAKYARQHAAPGDQASGSAERVREESDELEALLDAKRNLLRVAEARAAQARRVEAHYEKLFRSGVATDDLVLAAKDDVLLMDSLIAWGRVDLKVAELRVKNARRRASHGMSAADDAGRRLAELEQRVAVAEMKSDVLQHEVGRLRRQLPHEGRGR
jgi:hypothetical protein